MNQKKRERMLNIMIFLIGSLSLGADQIQVQVRFKYPDSNLRIEMYEAQPAYIFSVARTALVKNLKDAPIGEKLKLPLMIAENDSKTFVLVVQNKTDSARYFFANPHTYDPSHMSLDALFECLCNHHVYKIPPQSVWYRIVRIRFENENKNWKGSKKIDLNHTVVEVPEAKALKEYKQMMYEQIDNSLGKKQ